MTIVTTYVALLRGVNVGGHQVPMAALKKTLEGMGCVNVKTVLASGNAVFTAKTESLATLATHMESTLATAFEFSIPVLLRSGGDIAALIAAEPFKAIDATPETKCYVTFLPGKPKKSTIPRLHGGDFHIVRVADGAVCGVVRLAPGAGSVEYMAAVEQEYGKNVTTRNWNTVL